MKFLTHAVEVIKKGGVVAVPTETVYGLVANALDLDAVGKIYEIKRRSPEKPLALFVRDIKEARKFAVFTEDALKLAEAFWPGPLTMVLRATEAAPKPLVTPQGTIGIRIPDDQVVMAILDAAGVPLASTSANVSGMPPARTSNEVIDQLGDSVDFVIIGTAGGAAPSTVLDLTKERPIVIRKGPIPFLKVESIISKEVMLDRGVNMNVLFVCTGNLYRSQIAEAVTREYLPGEFRDRVFTESAGISALHGVPIPSDVVKVLEEMGIRVGDKRARPLNRQMIEKADIIYVMEKRHLEKLKSLGAGDKTRMLSYDDIPDPVGRSYPFIKMVAEGIKTIIERQVLPYILRKF